MFRRQSLDWRDDQQIRGAVNWVTALSNFSLEEAYFSYAAVLSGPTQKLWFTDFSAELNRQLTGPKAVLPSARHLPQVLFEVEPLPWW